MPTVAVDKADLWERLGEDYSVYVLLSRKSIPDKLHQQRKSLINSASTMDWNWMKMYVKLYIDDMMLTVHLDD